MNNLFLTPQQVKELYDLGFKFKATSQEYIMDLRLRDELKKEIWNRREYFNSQTPTYVFGGSMSTNYWRMPCPSILDVIWVLSIGSIDVCNLNIDYLFEELKKIVI